MRCLARFALSAYREEEGRGERIGRVDVFVLLVLG